MTLYIDNKLKFNANDVVSTITRWHPSHALLAVGSFSQAKGGFATIFQENGTPLPGYDWPTLQSNQVTSLGWHPIRKLLVVGWDGGEIFIWMESSWARLDAPHRTAVTITSFSPGGRRLITADASGSVCGWSSSSGAPLTSYHHQLSNTIVHIAFCAALPSTNGLIRGNARIAAVGADEEGLDALAAWRPRTTVRVKDESQLDNLTCYAALENGVIVFINTNGDMTEVFTASGVVHMLHTLSTKNILVAWENVGALGVSKLTINSDATLTSETHVRMSSRGGQSIILAGDATVVVLAGDTVIRYWNSNNGDNGVLALDEDTLSPQDIFTSIGYSEISDTLCCGTAQGNLYFWNKDAKHNWKLVSRSSVRGTVKHIGIGSKAGIQPLVSVNCITNIFILEEQSVCWGHSPTCSIVQKSASELDVGNFKEKKSSVVSAIKIKSLAFRNQYLAVTNGEIVEVWTNTKEGTHHFSLLHTFKWKTEFIIIQNDLIVGLATPHVECKTITGSPVGILPAVDGEGEPVVVTSTNNYLVIATLDGCLKVADINKQGLKLVHPMKNCFQVIEDFGEIMHASVNSSGSYVCFSIANAALVPDTKIYIWDCIRDVVESYTVPDLDCVSSHQFVPLSISWDSVDQRILSVHVISVECEKLLMYFCEDGKLYEHKDWLDYKTFPYREFVFCGLQIPYFVILKHQTLIRLKIKEFEDLIEVNPTLIRQTVEFIFNMTVGRLEKAVLTASNLAGGKSAAIWSGLAKACVKRKRPDVSAACLFKMGDFKGAMMLREALTDPTYSIEAQTGILAVNLNLVDQAERLFKESNRTDLLARLYSAKGIELTDIEETDFAGEAMMLKKSVQFDIAKALWNSDKIPEAVTMFEKAGATLPHIPKMLLSVGHHALEQYMNTCTEKDVIRWWGNYLESLGDLEGAIEAYSRIEDHGAKTRLHCHMGMLNVAEAMSAKEPAAAYQMARYLGLEEKSPDRAVKLYVQCNVVSAALRIAVDSQDPNLIWRAGSANARYATIAAEALQSLGETDRAVSLYLNAGQPLAALDLALALDDVDAARECVENVCNLENVSAISIEQPAAKLRELGCTAHAAALLAAAGQYSLALEALESDASGLTEEFAEKLVPPQGVAGRTELLRRLADVLGSRGFYTEAARRLAQAGDKSDALRWLLRSGDTEKVAAFATASRDKALLITAAGYLSSHGDWQSDVDIQKKILQLYLKAKAFEQVATFYAKLAKYEVTEQGDFEKALEYMKEMSKYLEKGDAIDFNSRGKIMQEQIVLLKVTVEVKNTLQNGDLKQGINAANNLLKTVAYQPGLLTEESILRMVVSQIGGTPEGLFFAERLKQLTSTHDDNEEMNTPNSEQSIEERL